jgi:hypothetical protein
MFAVCAWTQIAVFTYLMTFIKIFDTVRGGNSFKPSFAAGGISIASLKPPAAQARLSRALRAFLHAVNWRLMAKFCFRSHIIFFL